MPDYRRYRIPGSSYFFTVNLADRRSNLLTIEIDALRASVKRVRHQRPFHIDAWVVLPDHMHCLWTLPVGDDDFPGRWRAIKTLFTKAVLPRTSAPTIKTRTGEGGIWQRRYWEHHIQDERDYAAHMDYIHFNPVKHGLSSHPADWPFSSFRHCAARDLSGRMGRRRDRPCGCGRG